MRVAVTGGAGFIGSHIADALVAAGHAVLVVDNLSSGSLEWVPQGASLAQLDIREAAAIRECLTGFQPDAICHQAAQVSVAASVRDPALDGSVNVLGTVHMLDAAVAARARRFVFASTGGAIYGEVPEGQRASQKWAPAPQSPYAMSKLAAERYVTWYASHRGLRTTTLRYANVYGARQDPHGEAGVVAIFLTRLRTMRPLRINGRRAQGDDGCVRDYVYVDDVVRANLLALMADDPPTVLDVGTGIGTTTRELAATIAGTIGVRLTTEDAPPRTGDLGRNVLDPAECEALLGAHTPLANGLHLTAAAGSLADAPTRSAVSPSRP